MPQIACNGRAAVQVHVSENFPELYADASLVFNRARWMGDHLEAILGGKKLNQLALPASHDAAMYPGGFSFSILGKTQDLNIYGQLAYGVRYFDLRPKYKNDDFILHHDIIDGPQLSDVLDQIRQFFEEGHRELAVLKFSHYDGFDQDVFSKFCLRILDKTSGLGNWLYYANRPLETRLADRTLSTYLTKQGTALVVCDGSYLFPPSPSPSPPSTSPGGLFYYRDWESSDPGNGDLTVFDIYSNTTSFDTMANSKDPSEYGLPRGQLPKFRGNPPSYQGFNGKCLNDASIPCDLFLLSWTLTPITAVWPFSRLANKELVDNMAATGSNGFGQTVNLLYTDYSEYSRSTDVAVIRNGCAPT
jgi:hypothetical protein